MKNLTILLFIFIPLFSFSQSKAEIKANKIHSSTVHKTEQKDGQTISYKESYEEYDKNGNTILKIEYTKSGDIKKKQTYKFDKFGNEIERTDFDRKSGQTVKKTIKYDPNGEKSEETSYDSEGNLIEKVTYKVDSKGLRLEAKEYNAKGELKWVKKYTHESN